jgi:ankyrin repeat protein
VQCKVLLAHGANVNARQKQQRTALHFAAAKGNADLVRYLLGKVGPRVSRCLHCLACVRAVWRLATMAAFARAIIAVLRICRFLWQKADANLRNNKNELADDLTKSATVPPPQCGAHGQPPVPSDGTAASLFCQVRTLLDEARTRVQEKADERAQKRPKESTAASVPEAKKVRPGNPILPP